MLALELFESDFKTNDLTLIDALRDFLPLAVKTLELPHIPKISLEKSIEKSNVPTFGRFTNDDDHVYVHVANRNPNDILRTLAHELVHYKQRTEHELGSGSWHTGSPAENQAHELAGVIMRNFNGKYPQYLRMKPVILPSGNGTKELDEAWSEKYKRSINCANPKGFSQKAHCAGRKKHNESADYERDMQSDPSNPIPFPKGTTLVNVSDVYDWYKLGMAVPALDKADPRVFNKGVPHTVFAFGSEEEEHRMMPLLKRLGFTLHDIDRPEDYEKAIRASDVVEHLEQYVAENLVEAKDGCPPATQDISLNLKNRQKAIDEYHYGPLNPNLPNEEYWSELANKWNTKDIDSVKQNRCGNCGAFDLSEEMQACIAKGIGSEPGSNAMDSVDAGQLGYCKFLKFKCASKRTCDAWIEGGPIAEQLDENLRDWFKKEKWVRMDTKGKIKGPCAREPGEGKPKCLPQAKAYALGKKGRASAAQRKRREDPNPERSGKAINVATKEGVVDENCWKGYHKEGNKKMFGKTVPNCVKNEGQESCPECGGAMYPDTMINEKQDACYYKVKSRYKVWPSAYASGALVQCRKKGAKNWGNKSESVAEGKRCDSKGAVPELKAALDNRKKELNKLSDKQVYSKIDKIMTRIANTYDLTGQELHDMWTERYGEIPDTYIIENFADGKKPGRKGLAKRSGVNCKQSVTKLRSIAKHSSGEKQRMAHWCANMKAGKK